MAAALLTLLAACSAAPTPTQTLAPIVTPIPQALIDQAAEFCPPPPNWVIYVTQPGDSLQSLAARTSSSVMRLETANCLNNPRGISAGSVIYLPRPPIAR